METEILVRCCKELIDDMMKLCNRTRRLIGISIIIVSMISMLIWEIWVKEKLFYDEAIVLKYDVERGTEITEDMLDKVLIPDLQISTCLKVGDEGKLSSKEAVQFIKGGTPVCDEYFSPVGSIAEASSGTLALIISKDVVMGSMRQLECGEKILLYSKDTVLSTAIVGNVDVDGDASIILEEHAVSVILEAIYSGDKLSIVRIGE